MKIRTIISATVLSVLMVACSSSGSSGGGGDAALNGSWALPCSTDGTRSIDAVLVINGTSLTRSVREYLFDPNCNPSTGILFTNLIGSLTLPGGTTPSAGGDLTHINVTFNRATYTANAQFQAQIAADMTTLQQVMLDARGVQDINNVPLTNFVSQPSTFSVYRIDGTTLSTGDEDGAGNDGTTAALRHTILDASETYTRE